MTPSLLTIFSAPKPFTDPHIHMIQRNAIQSWLALGPEVEVILVGNDEGIAETAAEFGVRHLPEVDCSRWGTPLVNSIFDLARQTSQSPLLCYVNADILLFDDLLEAGRAAYSSKQPFLIVGQRWDWNVQQSLDFTSNWTAVVKSDLQQHGNLHAPDGSDYFLFPREQFLDMPAFSIGRAGWDNWMIYHAIAQGWLAIDATSAVMIIHQNHDYRHLSNGEPHYRHPESARNRELAGGFPVEYSLLETNYCLHNKQLLPKKRDGVLLVRRLELWLLKNKNNSAWSRLLPRVRRFRKWFVSKVRKNNARWAKSS